MITLKKNCNNWSRWWLQNWMFTRLSLFQKKNYNLNTIDLSKQQKLDANPKAMQQINYTGNLNRAEDAKMFFITEKTKETVLDFSKETVKVSWFQFVLL